ncbi:MAG: DUF2953 domain-containing protein [Oscillospiraceae bacterium]
MTALWIILAIALVLTVLNLLPVGVDAAYTDETFSLVARVGPLRLRLLPKPPDAKPKKKPPKPKKEKPKKKSASPDIRTILALAKLGLQVLNRFRQRLRVQLLRLVFVSGAPDPYDTALAFGYVNAALGALTPLAERALRIDERDIQTGVDFQAERPRIDARIVCTIRIGQIVVIALAFGVGFLKQKMHSKQARATRTNTAPAAQERKVSNG